MVTSLEPLFNTLLHETGSHKFTLKLKMQNTLHHGATNKTSIGRRDVLEELAEIALTERAEA